MDAGCPGRRVRTVESVEVLCPACGRGVELFTDEIKARCRCGEVILREALPSCAMWCPAAERCLGKVIDLRLVQQRVDAQRRNRECDEYVRKIGRRIEESRRRSSANGARAKGKGHKGSES